MAWPDDRDLPIEVDAAFGADVAADPGTWAWTSLSSRLRAEPIRLRAGKSGGAARVSPGTCTVTLINDDGALTPLHPMSPYWPNVDLNTPVRVRLRRVEDTFARTASNGWGTTAAGDQWLVNGVTSAYSVAAGVGRQSHPDTNTIRRASLAVTLNDSEQIADIAASALLSGSSLVTGFVFRYTSAGYYWARCEFNPGGTVTLKLSRYTPATGHVDLATLGVVPGVSYSANTYLRVRAAVSGTSLGVKVWPTASPEPAGWHITATDSVVTWTGRVGCQSWLVIGNSNTLPVTALHKTYTVYVDRFSGGADQWEPTYLPTGVAGQAASAVRITASGVLRRLGQGRSLVSSPIFRGLSAFAPTGYLPLEDGNDSTLPANVVPGGRPGSAFDVAYGADDSLPGASTSVRLNSASSFVTLTNRPPAGNTAWTFVCYLKLDALPPGGDVTLLRLKSTGTVTEWILQVSNGGYRWYGTNAAGSIVFDKGQLHGEQAAPTRWVAMTVSATQNGGNVEARIYWHGLGSNTVYRTDIAGFFSYTGSIGNVSSATVGPSSILPGSVGHMAVFGQVGPEITVSFTKLSNGYIGETAGRRILRLGVEQGIPVGVAGDPDDTEAMGRQEVDTFLNLLASCEAVDGGILHERGPRLAYLPRAARYNKAVDVTVDLATYAQARGAADPLVPVYDDQDIRNEWLVERPNGSSAVASDPVSQRRGVYPDSVELNVADDSRLLDHATWRLHLDTDVDLREATFPIDLAANPTLLDGWLSCQVGARIVRTNPPAQHPPGPLDRLVLGWTETIGPRSWLVQVVPVPAAPWDVAQADGAQRAPADGSTLAAPLSSSAASFLLASTVSNGVWTTAAADFPMDVRVGGERMTLSGITGTSSPQTATVSARGVNGVQRAWPTGTEVDVWQPAVSPL
ncbi:hypothetical protein AB0B39_23685 [Micromonospora sp. NPDC049114]|uniref:hypothetical protein n=1 Tax=Micromonospora sp. NPDC049114 TaxID=3155498 RepID=UPI0033D79FEE